ncbi:unnamed protein product [Pocillopora meandrina]|uniref:Uncharacterized protein n=1 Tax=Pocillopora meandrina TaxID=46732 RepID=A0AAU9W6I2_9CNID|nr:unnamed protein product [Pocillopora meandrina]
MQSIEHHYYRETEEHNYNGCKLLVKKDMLDSLDGKERSYDNSTNGGPSLRLEKKPTINS